MRSPQIYGRLEPVVELFKAFHEETGREIKLEVEPGTLLLKHACSLVTSVQDITSTGSDGYRFLKLDGGMTEILRPSLRSSAPNNYCNRSRTGKISRTHQASCGRSLL